MHCRAWQWVLPTSTCEAAVRAEGRGGGGGLHGTHQPAGLHIAAGLCPLGWLVGFKRAPALSGAFKTGSSCVGRSFANNQQVKGQGGWQPGAEQQGAFIALPPRPRRRAAAAAAPSLRRAAPAGPRRRGRRRRRPRAAALRVRDAPAARANNRRRRRRLLAGHPAWQRQAALALLVIVAAAARARRRPRAASCAPPRGGPLRAGPAHPRGRDQPARCCARGGARRRRRGRGRGAARARRGRQRAAASRRLAAVQAVVDKVPHVPVTAARSDVDA